MKLVENLEFYTEYSSNNKNYLLYSDEDFFYQVEISKSEWKHRANLSPYSIYEEWATDEEYKYKIKSIKKFPKNSIIENHKTTPLFQNIGMEWEFNKNTCSYKSLFGDVKPWEDLNPPFTKLKDENETIWEAITEPLSIHNLPLLLGVGFRMAQAGAIKEQKGYSDPLAGSMHTHIDIPNLGLWYYEFLYEKLKFIKWPGNFNAFFFKRALSVNFRTAIEEDNNSFVKDYFRRGISSKYSKIAINISEEKPPTLEFRINENPYPLWAFLLPSIFFTDSKKYNLEFSLNYWSKFLEQDNYEILKKVLPVYFEMQGDGEAFTEWLSKHKYTMNLNW